MDNSERRDTFAAGHGTIDANQVAVEVASARLSVEARLQEAEAILARMREHAIRLRTMPHNTDEQRELLALLDDAGSPLAYLVGFVESTIKNRT